MRKWIGKIHLWLGLITGPVVFIVALTGCIYAFQKEISDVTAPYKKVEKENTPILSPSVLGKIAENAMPGKKLHSLLYADSQAAVQAIFFANAPVKYYDILYINPYSGKILKNKNMNQDFFRIILMGHYYLWLPEDIGQPIVAYATLLFTIILISGLCIWWPKNKAARKQRLALSFKGRWRRKNYNWHNVSGFYALSLALVFAITGLVFGFQWFANGWYQCLGGKKSLTFEEPPIPTPVNNAYPAIDQLFALYKNGKAPYFSAEYHLPETSKSPVLLALNRAKETYYTTDFLFFNPDNLKPIPVNHIYSTSTQLPFADQLLRMNYDIHIGSIGGFAGKCLAFVISLIIAALPVTGYLIYFGRKRK